MNFISFENRKNCTPTILSKTVCVYFRRRLCSSSLGVHDKRTWRRRSNHQPKYSSNATIFMQLAPRSTNQSTRLNGAIFMSHSLFTSWASMSILSFPRMHMTIQTRRRSHRAPTKVLLKRPYLHAAGASLHQPRYSVKRCNLRVAFALHIMGFDVHPFFSLHAYNNTNK